MTPLELTHLPALMELTHGRADVTIGLIDGPVAMAHPDLAGARIREVPGKLAGTCRQGGVACQHGTFVAGVLVARRGSRAPAICPSCTLLVCPIFSETTSENGQIPSATPEALASAIIECAERGARVINVSAGLGQPSAKSERALEEALGHATRRGVIVVAAAGNQATLGSSAITRDPGVVPVVACDLRGRPISQSNLGASIGKRGLRAPGDEITSLGVNGTPLKFGGTSAAAPFVTGTIALLWSAFPEARPAEIRLAVTRTEARRRTSVVPLLLDAWAAYDILSTRRQRSGCHD
jgi:subtilisin family serine protease